MRPPAMEISAIYCLVYRVAPLTYVLGRMLVKIKHIDLVNILAGDEVVREFIQLDADPRKVAPVLHGFLESPDSRRGLA
jgi:lipid-A-disaccharide synthase